MSNRTVEDNTSRPQARRPVYQTETTGNYWSDVREAAKRLSPRDDWQRLSDIPCARNSLLSAIASGFGVGVVRSMSVRPIVACNWAVGTFVLVSLGTWHICHKNIVEERMKIQSVVEELPRRMLASKEPTGSQSESSTPQS
ncbi:hypothetical protein FA95DRAFT_1604431 [Auriscalpium vulgare]|uniref:Uncharacterized protein n=1 Tax=Auriscalpium vulgare TaxID=40419 RepID=A0ACB8RZJ6_9AGAM|nr:hypothetical protein FA95DRAFT_1604431 [Auriscalpium vulgare]